MVSMSRSISSLFLILTFSTFPARAAELRNADVIKLVQAGLSVETLLTSIETSVPMFETDADSLVALAKSGVPDLVIRVMIQRQAGVSPASPHVSPATPPAPATTVEQSREIRTMTPKKPRPRKRFEVSIHRSRNARCSTGELEVSTRGILAKQCHDLNFQLDWKEIRGICYEYGTRGSMVIRTEQAEYRVSTSTPAEITGIRDTIRSHGHFPASSTCAE